MSAWVCSTGTSYFALDVQRHKEFVAAGDNPEYRDVVVVLRQLRQGLERLQLSLSSSQSRWKELLADAKGVRVAVQLDLEGDEVVSKSDLKGYDVVAKDRWFTATEDFEEPVFSFDALDRIDISTHFAPEQ